MKGAINDKTILNGSDAMNFALEFLDKKGILSDNVKRIENKDIRNELIRELKLKSNLSIRQLSGLLNIDGNIIQRAK